MNNSKLPLSDKEVKEFGKILQRLKILANYLGNFRSIIDDLEGSFNEVIKALQERTPKR